MMNVMEQFAILFLKMGGPKEGIFGKTVFLTQAEAEAKLKEMEG